MLKTTRLSPMIFAFPYFAFTFAGYEQFFHWTAGIDAFSNEFQLYWVALLYIATMAELIVFLCLVAYLWKTRDLAG